MNGNEYNGTFEHSSLWSCGPRFVAALMVPISWFLVEEPRVGGAARGRRVGVPRTAQGDGPSRRKAAAAVAAAVEVELEAEAEVVAGTDAILRQGDERDGVGRRLRHLLVPDPLAFLGEITTALVEVRKVWAQVQNLTSQIFGSKLIYILGLWLVRQRFLHVSWRWMVLVTMVFSTLVDIPFALTIYNVVRSQFFLDDALITAIPNAGFMVTSYVIVEVAEVGAEAFTASSRRPITSAAPPPASNVIFGAFRPSLSDSANYLKDAPSFRDSVALSFGLTYAFSLASLLLLPLLPDQKEEAVARKAAWPRLRAYACAMAALPPSSTTNVLAIPPSTSCSSSPAARAARPSAAAAAAGGARAPRPR